MSVKNLASAEKNECHFQVPKLLLYWFHFPEMEIRKDSLESLKDLIETHETKLILEQNYTFFLSFMGVILSSLHTFKKNCNHWRREL